MARSYNISKLAVQTAYERVKANKGAPGTDDITLQEFEKELEKNLYKLWNRMTSGTYFPPAVKKVGIPKADGKIRELGIPTVGDRIAQMVVKIYLEPIIDPIFHEDSYGYRPNKSALQAVEKARTRCWKYDWVIDIDIKGFFDNIDHELMMHAVKKQTQEPWILLYVQRWLEAPAQESNGNITERKSGTPQGGVISPLLANLFLHYVFDTWISEKHSQNPFERYADDIVIHCKTEEEAVRLKEAIKIRFQRCKLELHPDKTKIVYCKDANRNGNSQHKKFDFLGYTFKPRTSRNRYGKLFTNFTPAISDKKKKKVREEIKAWLKEIKSNNSLKDFARMINPVVTGWINYYGKFIPSELRGTMLYIERTLQKWAKKKYNQFKRGWQKTTKWSKGIRKRTPSLFKHWQWMHKHDLSRRAV